MLRIVLAFAASALLAGQALAEPALTASATIMRNAPGPKAGIVQSIPARAEIDLSHCQKDWCYASWRDRFGYISARAVAAGPEGGPVAYGYGLPPPFVEGPPVYPVYRTWGWGFSCGFGPGCRWGD